MKKFIVLLMLCLNLFYGIFANEIIDEYKTQNCNIVLEEIEFRSLYKISVYNSKGDLIKSMEPFNCYNRGWIHYMGQDFFSIYGGSFQAPDCFCYIYDANKNRLSDKIFLPVCFDIKNELVLTAENEITVSKIFNPNEKIVIDLPDDICSFIQLWDRIRINDTAMENGKLYLSYNVFRDKQKLKTYGKTKIFSLDSLLSTNETPIEFISEKTLYEKNNSKNNFVHVIVILIIGIVSGYFLGKIKLHQK